jgi:hypothetical protein
MFRSLRAIIVVVMITVLWSGLGCASTATTKEIEATTNSGEKVTLHPDGTWNYKKILPLPATPPGDYSISKPPSASTPLISKKKFATLWHDEDKWVTMEQTPHPLIEFFLIHMEGEAYATLSAERVSASSLQAFKELSQQMTERVTDSFQVIWEEERTINDKQFLAVKADVTVQGMDLTYYFYYWTGKAGNLVLSAWTGKNIFDEYSEDMMELFSGLVINQN